MLSNSAERPAGTTIHRDLVLRMLDGLGVYSTASKISEAAGDNIVDFVAARGARRGQISTVCAG